MHVIKVRKHYMMVTNGN